MCGIAGVCFPKKSNIENASEIQNLLEVMKHRGPDNLGIRTIENGLSLGMVRLSIVDIAGSFQPMNTECERDSYLELVFNGEIYNFAELRVTLKSRGHKFISEFSDTETIIHSFSEWGETCFEKFDGMFAIAIYDRKAKVLTLARDRFGEKPLFIYHDSTGNFAFASELKALLRLHAHKLEIDSDTEIKYLLNGFFEGTKTVFKDITQVSPGELIQIKLDGSLTRKIWPKIDVPKSLPKFNRHLLESRFETLFLNAVAERISYEVPTGLFLSGGLDSTAIAVATQELGLNIKGFSIGFQNPNYDESSFVRNTTNWLGIDYEIKELTELDLIENFSVLAKTFDQPIADPSIFPTYMVSQLAAKEVKVVLGGDGSDELAYGYNLISGLEKLEKYTPLLKLSVFDSIFQKTTKFKSFNTKLGRALALLDLKESGIDEVTAGLSPFSHFEYCKYFSNCELDGRHRRTVSSFSSSLSKSEEVHWRQSYLTGYLANNILVKVDRMSMLNSLEVRSPFLDKDLSSFLLSLDKSFHRKRSKGKLLVRNYLKDKIPKEILHKKKTGFGFPLSEWVSGDFGLYVEEIFREEEYYPECLSRDRVMAAFSNHRKGSEDNGIPLWSILTLLCWRRNILSKGD